MDVRIKNYVGVALVASLAAFAIAGLWYVNAYSKSIDPSSLRSFSVVGEGKAVAIPDVARFTFEVITEGGTDLSALQTQNIDKANAAIEFIKSKGVKKEDIRTEAYNIVPRQEYFTCPLSDIRVPVSCPPPKISVKVRDFAETGAIMAGVVDKGANSVSQLTFTVDDRTEVENAARKEAIAKAEAKAWELAAAGKFKVGRLISIYEQGEVPPMYYKEAYGRAFDVAQTAPSPELNVEAGSDEIIVSMTLTYEIK